MDDTLNNLPHSISINDRKNVSLTGITDVGSFDENSVSLVTSCGELTVKGENLQVTELSLDRGIVSIEGIIIGIEYFEPRKKQGSILSRLMG